MLPHGDEPVLHAGAPLDHARVAMILVHGRGAGPANILDLVPRFARPGVAYLAPAAAGNTWYPSSFLSERERNEPGISSGLWALQRLVHGLAERGFASERVLLGGFSQGGCLVSEFVYRHPADYGGVIVFSGGLIGPPGTQWPIRNGALSGVAVFLGCSDVDAHVPAERVRETERVFRGLGARVRCTLYPGMGHLVNDDEIAEARLILDAVLGEDPGSP
jgi:predicted esterase